MFKVQIEEKQKPVAIPVQMKGREGSTVSFALRPNPALRACCHASAKGGEGGGRWSALPCVLTRPCVRVAMPVQREGRREVEGQLCLAS
jgi:hypothetical protein